MRRRAGTFSAAGIRLFPLLAVMICTTGALVTLLIGFARQGQQALDEAAQQSGSQAEDRESLEWRIGQLSAVRDKTESDLSAARAELSHLEDHLRRLRERGERLRGAIAESAGIEPGKLDKQRAAADELERLRRPDQGRRASRCERRRDADGKPVKYSVVPYEGPFRTNRRPIYLECRKDSVVLQPEGIVFGDSDFAGPLGPGNPIAAALRAAREYLANADPDNFEKKEPYPLLLVRPDAIEAYYAAQAAVSSWGSQFGYELVGADWQLDYPEPDPQMAAVMNNAIAEARVRQQQLMAVAPREYRKAKPTFRVKPGGGGIEPDPAAQASRNRNASNPYKAAATRGGAKGGGGNGLGGNSPGGNATAGNAQGGNGTGAPGANRLAGGPGGNGPGGNGPGGNGPGGNGPGGNGPGGNGPGGNGPGGNGPGGNGPGGNGPGGNGPGGNGPGGNGPGGNGPGGNGPGGNGPGGNGLAAGGPYGAGDGTGNGTGSGTGGTAGGNGVGSNGPGSNGPGGNGPGGNALAGGPGGGNAARNATGQGAYSGTGGDGLGGGSGGSLSAGGLASGSGGLDPNGNDSAGGGFNQPGGGSMAGAAGGGPSSNGPCTARAAMVIPIRRVADHSAGGQVALRWRMATGAATAAACLTPARGAQETIPPATDWVATRVAAWAMAPAPTTRRRGPPAAISRHPVPRRGPPTATRSSAIPAVRRAMATELVRRWPKPAGPTAARPG